MTCGGNFSQTVFDNLERKKQELRKASFEGRRLMRVFAKQLLLQEKRQEKIERRMEEITRRQDKMLERESAALGELSEWAPALDEPDQQVMGWEDDFFLFDDPSSLGFGLGQAVQPGQSSTDEPPGGSALDDVLVEALFSEETNQDGPSLRPSAP